LEARTDAHTGATGLIEMTVDVRYKKQLEKLWAQCAGFSGIRDVERLLSYMPSTDPATRISNSRITID